MRSPPTVENAKAMTPRRTILRVSHVRNVVPQAVAPTVVPRQMVTILQRALEAVSERRSVTPDSLKMLPSISIPSRGATEGIRRAHTATTMSVTTTERLSLRRLLAFVVSLQEVLLVHSTAMDQSRQTTSTSRTVQTMLR